jgi:hypothetical protein
MPCKRKASEGFLIIPVLGKKLPVDKTCFLVRAPDIGTNRGFHRVIDYINCSIKQRAGFMHKRQTLPLIYTTQIARRRASKFD